jgi:membrane-bound lytic murein transglycosylase MltF
LLHLRLRSTFLQLAPEEAPARSRNAIILNLSYVNGNQPVIWAGLKTVLQMLAAGVFALAASAVLADTGGVSATPKPAEARGAAQLLGANKPWTGDFNGMLERRIIRVLVPFSRSLYFVDKGRERGITAELALDFEKYLNKKYAKHLRKRPLTVFLIVTTRDKLFTDLAAGLGDISAGNLTVTPDREQVADFVAPADRAGVNELLITGPSSPPVTSVDDLAGRTVHARKASSYYESLAGLNDKLRAAGKQSVDIAIVPDALEDEDMMEMANAGLLQAIVVDDWKARMWAQVLPKITVHTDILLRSGGRTGWAIRKGSPGLAAEISDFYETFAKKEGVINARVARAMKQAKQLKDPTTSAGYQRFEATIALFRKYGEQYRFDPLMLAALGFQESELNQNKKSAVGAIGVMQVMPQTGAELSVGDIRVIEPNIHAGSKYLDGLMSEFLNAQFDDANRALFAFASYNCGSGNVAKARKEAAKRGLDPDKWFNNVEIVIAERIGMETTTYVRNIYKYYMAYRLVADARAGAKAARGQVAPPKN